MLFSDVAIFSFSDDLNEGGIFFAVFSLAKEKGYEEDLHGPNLKIDNVHFNETLLKYFTIGVAMSWGSTFQYPQSFRECEDAAASRRGIITAFMLSWGGCTCICAISFLDLVSGSRCIENNVSVFRNENHDTFF